MRVGPTGSYSEMYTFVSQGIPLLPKRPSNPNAAFIVSAFKTAGNLDSLDRSWTGIRSVLVVDVVLEWLSS